MDLLPKDKIAPSLRGIKINKISDENGEQKWVYFVLVILIVVLLLAGGLEIYRRSLSAKSDSITQELQSLNNQNNSEQVEKVVALEGKIINAKYLFDNHLYSSNILRLLEEATLPTVTWTNFNFFTDKSNIIIDGYAPTWLTVASQIVAFEQKDLKVTSITKLAAEEDKGIVFSLILGYKYSLIKK